MKLFQFYLEYPKNYEIVYFPIRIVDAPAEVSLLSFIYEDDNWRFDNADPDLRWWPDTDLVDDFSKIPKIRNLIKTVFGEME